MAMAESLRLMQISAAVVVASLVGPGSCIKCAKGDGIEEGQTPGEETESSDGDHPCEACVAGYGETGEGDAKTLKCDYGCWSEEECDKDDKCAAVKCQGNSCVCLQDSCNKIKCERAEFDEGKLGGGGGGSDDDKTTKGGEPPDTAETPTPTPAAAGDPSPPPGNPGIRCASGRRIAEGKKPTGTVGGGEEGGKRCQECTVSLGRHGGKRTCTYGCMTEEDCADDDKCGHARCDWGGRACNCPEDDCNRIKCDKDEIRATLGDGSESTKGVEPPATTKGATESPAPVPATPSTPVMPLGGNEGDTTKGAAAERVGGRRRWSAIILSILFLA